MGQLEDMQLFIRVVETGSISRAAEQLHIAKSAVSRRLAELERRLGTQLLQRTTRVSHLTEAGQSYYERALQVLDDVDEMHAQVMDSRCQLSGRISLAAPLTFGLNHLSPAIDRFVKLHPEISLSIDFSDRHIDLVEEGIDLAFRIGQLKDSSLIAKPLSPIRFHLCASGDYLNQFGTPQDHNELQQHRLLRYTLSTPAWRLTDANGQTHEFVPQAKLEANNGDFLNRMAINGQGIGLIPSFICWQALARGQLKRILPEYTLPTTQAYAIYPQNRYQSLRVKSLIDFLGEQFGEFPYWDHPL